MNYKQYHLIFWRWFFKIFIWLFTLGILGGAITVLVYAFQSPVNNPIWGWATGIIILIVFILVQLYLNWLGVMDLKQEIEKLKKNIKEIYL